MSLREKLLHWLLPPGMKIVPTEEDILEEVSVVPEEVSVEQDNTQHAPKKMPIITAHKEYVCGESNDTTGVIYKLADGHYQYYWYDGNISSKPFVCVRYDVESLLEIQKKWVECGYDMSKRGQVHGCKRNPRNSMNYVYKRGNTYAIRRRNRQWGTTPTFQQANYISNYLQFKKWDPQYKARNLTSAHRKMQGNEYYLTMRPIIEHDKDYQQYLHPEGTV